MIGCDLNYEGREGGLRILERMKWSEVLLEACRLFFMDNRKIFSVPERQNSQDKIPGLESSSDFGKNLSKIKVKVRHVAFRF